MKTLHVRLGKESYPIEIGRGLLGVLGPRLKREGVEKALIITDRNVYKQYGNSVEKSLRSTRISFDTIQIDAGEAGKNFDSLRKIYQKLADSEMQRDSWIIALGGGAIGDVAGFAAATYMRGIPFVQVPTTLLAQTDASIGGKTAINFSSIKNLVGAFHQPRFVLIDLNTLETLAEMAQKETPRLFLAGLAEVVKYGVIDPIRIGKIPFFSFLEKNANTLIKLNHLQNHFPLWEIVIATSCQVKANVVSKDEKEQGIRATLNFGHTVGHAIEALMNYKCYHGEAISIGMVAESLIAQKMGLFKERNVIRLKNLLEQLQLPIHLKNLSHLKMDDILHKFQLDKKVKTGKVRFVLPIKIGKVILRDDVPISIIQEALKEVGCNG